MTSKKLTAEQEAKNLERIRSLAKLPGNDKCADCGSKFPRFASITLGVFLCNRCYGIHRNVGAHITRTKCIGLDTWKTEEVEFMQKMGNVKAAETWLGALPGHIIPPSATASDDEVERWIRSKYERRLYFKASDQSDPRETSASHHRPVIAPTQEGHRPSAMQLPSRASQVATTGIETGSASFDLFDGHPPSQLQQQAPASGSVLSYQAAPHTTLQAPQLGSSQGRTQQQQFEAAGARPQLKHPSEAPESKNVVLLDLISFD